LEKKLEALTKRLEYFLNGSQDYTEEEQKNLCYLAIKDRTSSAEVLAEKEKSQKKILAITPQGY
jgi:hypothetical protein